MMTIANRVHLQEQERAQLWAEWIHATGRAPSNRVSQESMANVSIQHTSIPPSNEGNTMRAYGFWMLLEVRPK